MSSISNKELIRLAKIAKKKYRWKFKTNYSCNSYTKECCFLGGAIIGKQKGDCSNVNTSRLYLIGRSLYFINGVISGFDNSHPNIDTGLKGSHKTAFLNGIKLGQKARKLFLK